jgi:hypothetical protein
VQELLIEIDSTQILGYMYNSSVFHHQGYEILKDLEPYMRDLTGTKC